MKQKIFKVLLLLCVMVFLICTGYLAVQSFIQIDMTKMRFSVTFWKEELGLIVSFILGCYCIWQINE